MAKRIATVYVQTHIRLTEAEMIDFVELFRQHHIHTRVRVFDNGNHEVVLENGENTEITLNFEYQQGAYIFEGSCSFFQAAPANAMRKAISAFKGTAVVHRHYMNFMMEYVYERGIVVSIIERKFGEAEKVVYRYKNTIAELQALYERTDVETNIERLREEINAILDMRLRIDAARRPELDRKLTDLSRRLFALEA